MIVVPRLSRLAVLGNPDSATYRATLADLQAPMQSAAVKMVRVDIRRPEEIEPAFAILQREQAQAVIVVHEALIFANRRHIVELAARHRLAAVYGDREYVMTGGLMSYATNITENYRRAAGYVDRIFKGAKPGDLPVEQPTKFELVVNIKTARALGLTIPQDFLLRADEVIR